MVIYKKDITDTRVANDTYLNAYKPQVIAGYDVDNKEVLEMTLDSAGSLKSNIATIEGKVSTLNSTSTPLGIGGVFTGTSEDVTNLGHINIAVYSDVASATDGLSIEFSTDNVNWDHTDVYTIVSAIGKTFSVQPSAQYFRVVYTNGAIAQTDFRLQVNYKSVYVKPSSHRLADAISGQDDAELVKAGITGTDNAGTFINFGTNSPMPVIDLDGTAIAQGNLTGYSNVQKFGHNEAVTTTLETIWSQGGLYTNPTTATTMTTSSDDVNDVGTLLSTGTATGGSATTLVDTGATFVSDGVVVGDILINDTEVLHGIITAVDSETQVTIMNLRDGGVTLGVNESGDSYRIATSGGTGAAVCRIQGLDSNYNTISEYIILNGQTAVTSTKTYLRMNRMIIRKAGSSGNNIGVIYVGTGTVTAGVPANIYSTIGSTDNQTLQAFYTVPAGKTAFLTRWIIGVGQGRELEAKLLFRPFGEVYQVKQEAHAFQAITSFDFSVPLVAQEKTDIEVRGLLVSGSNVAVNSSFEITLIDN